MPEIIDKYSSCGDATCSTKGCRLWQGLNPSCERHAVEAVCSDAGLSLYALGLRAFALPLTIFLLAVLAIAQLPSTLGRDALGVTALLVALTCGFVWMRRAARSGSDL